MDELNPEIAWRYWQRPGFWVGLALVMFAGAVGFCFLDIPGYLSGDTDIFGRYEFVAKKQQERAEMTPMQRVHAELFPRWTISAANRWRADSDAAARKFPRRAGDSAISVGLHRKATECGREHR